jgi:hypothetical protein
MVRKSDSKAYIEGVIPEIVATFASGIFADAAVYINFCGGGFAVPIGRSAAISVRP